MPLSSTLKARGLYDITNDAGDFIASAHTQDERDRLLVAVNAFGPMREALKRADKQLGHEGYEPDDPIRVQIEAALKLAGDAT